MHFARVAVQDQRDALNVHSTLSLTLTGRCCPDRSHKSSNWWPGCCATACLPHGKATLNCDIRSLMLHI